jgi:ABC-type amino acid transport substrate-binding protein
MESPSIEYIVQRNCDLVQIGGLLNSKNYGLAVAQNSPLRKILSQGILHLQETGVLVQIKDKWWSAGEC